MTNASVRTTVAHNTRRKMLPLLIILFVISYGLLTRMVVEQSRTINSQRSLIHLLFKDNLHYVAALKAGMHWNHGIHAMPNTDMPNAHAFSSQNGSSQIPLIPVPSEQVRSEQVPSVQVPSNKARSRASAKSDRKLGKAGRQPSTRPPAEMTDPSDMRRVSFAI